MTVRGGGGRAARAAFIAGAGHACDLSVAVQTISWCIEKDKERAGKGGGRKDGRDEKIEEKGGGLSRLKLTANARAVF